MYIEIKVLLLELLGPGNAAEGNIDAGHLKTHRCEYLAVSSFTAGHIQHAAARGRVEVFDQFFDKRLCLFLISFKIKFVIEW